MTLEILLLIIGFGVAFLSGLLGLGGAILLIPVLIFLPPALGLGTLDMKVIAGITVIQVLFSSLVSLYKHRENGFVSRQLILVMGSSMMAGSLAGALLSKALSSQSLEITFALLALAAGVMMFLPSPADQEVRSVEDLNFSVSLATGISLILGFFNGMIGAAGAFILIPVMVYLLKIPLRIAIGSAFGIVFLSALAASAGKIATGQVDFVLATAAVAGSLAGAYWGSTLSKKVHLHFLKYGLALLIAGVGVKTLWELLFSLSSS